MQNESKTNATGNMTVTMVTKIVEQLEFLSKFSYSTVNHEFIICCLFHKITAFLTDFLKNFHQKIQHRQQLCSL